MCKIKCIINFLTKINFTKQLLICFHNSPRIGQLGPLSLFSVFWLPIKHLLAIRFSLLELNIEFQYSIHILFNPLHESMKSPRTPFIFPLFNHHKKSSSLFSHFSTPESTQFPNQQRFNLLYTKILSSSVNPENKDFNCSHNLDSPTPQKPTYKIASFDNLSIKNVAFHAHFLGTFETTQKPLNFIQIRLFSASPSDHLASNSDPIPVVSTVTSPFESSPPIDAGSSIRKPISLWPGMYLSPVTNALWEARTSIFERLSNIPESAPPQSELITKSPSKSRTSILYKFSDDYILREQYRNPWNEIRMGKLLEDLDALAGTISFKVESIFCTDLESVNSSSFFAPCILRFIIIIF